MTSFFIEALHSAALIVGPAVAAFLVTILVLYTMERILERRSRESLRAVEEKHVTRRFSRRVADGSRKKKKRTLPQGNPEVQPIEVKVRFRRHEWRSTPAESLKPKADWN